MRERYKEIHEDFLRLEKELNLFSLEVDDVRVWERIRHKAHRELLKECGLIGQAHGNASNNLFQKSPIKKYPQFAYRWLKGFLIRNPYFTTHKDILFLGHQRRKKRDDGYWWDIYCDPITEELDLDYLHVEDRYQGSHKKPARTGNLRYLDLIKDTRRVLKKLGFADVAFSSSEEQKIQKITEDFKSKFGVSVNFKDMIEDELSMRKPDKWMYGRLVKRVDPEIAVVVVGDYRKNFIEACNQNNVPVVELQHGVIHKYHLGHHFPEGVEVDVYPDYVLTFGKYWRDSVNFPIDDGKVIPVGYPYLETESEKYAGVEERNQVLFISQGTIGEELSKFAVELNERIDDYDIVYKHHPKEYEGWESKYPWLKDADLSVIAGDDPQLYRLFAESTVQVGVHSTALYEGLNFGLNTYILDLPGKQVVEYLIESGYASKIDSVEDLLTRINTDRGRTGSDTEYIFKKNGVKNTLEALNKIRNET